MDKTLFTNNFKPGLSKSKMLKLKQKCQIFFVFLGFWFQFTRDDLLPLSVLYHCELNNLGLGAFVQTNQAI